MSSRLPSAQRAVVKMIFDPSFAAAVRAGSANLSDIDTSMRAQLAAVDPRALKLDRYLRERTLRTLFDELTSSMTLALAETGSYGFLLQFFSSPFFHRAIDESSALVFAFTDYLADAQAHDRLKAPLFNDVLRLETASAGARRAIDSATSITRADLEHAATLTLAPSVTPIELDSAALSLIQETEQHLFAVGMMPAMSLCDDAPALAFDQPTSGERTHIMVVSLGGQVSLVTIDRELQLAAEACVQRGTFAEVLAACLARGLSEPIAREKLGELADGDLLIS